MHNCVGLVFFNWVCRGVFFLPSFAAVELDIRANWFSCFCFFAKDKEKY